jgi:hypothetical protein
MSGNYQSRVFTFINSRTNQLKDTCGKGLRHLKVAVVWTSQILLYPLHLLAQTTKIFQSQLPSPPPQISLPQPAPDLNIEQALNLIVDAGYPIVISDRGTLAANNDPGNKDRLQRLSPNTAISTLVDENSWNLEHYDPDTEDWEISSYSPKSRRVTARKPIVRGLSSLLIDRQLVLVTTENQILDVLTVAQQQEIRRRIGIDLAIYWQQWQNAKLSDRQSDRQLSSTDRQLLLNDLLPIEQLAISGAEEYSTSPTLLDRWRNWLKKLTIKSPESIAEIEPQPPHQLPSANYPFTPQPPRIDRYLDLPQLPPIVEIQPVPDRDRQLQDKIFQSRNYAKLQPNWLKQWWNYYRDYLSIPSKDDRQIVDRLTEFKLTPIEPVPERNRLEKTPKKQNSTDRNSGQLSKKTSQDLAYQPDWIEAESETIGYNQSLIARFLAWLDRIFFNLENWLIKIWEMITNRAAQS